MPAFPRSGEPPITAPASRSTSAQASGSDARRDFSSALYLGLHHAHRDLSPWPALTLGVPVVLRAPPDADAVARRLAGLVGCEAALLGPSTFHLLWDLVGCLARQQAIEIWIDAAAYAVSRWASERAASLGTPVREFRHLDARDLAQRIEAWGAPSRRPVVLLDGTCPGCGRAAPLAAMTTILRPLGGIAVVDDSQGLGILGRDPRRTPPYGMGGGGILRHTATFEPGVVLVSSLAKGLGTPVAMLGGERKTVQWFAAYSETRMHTSPPSAAAIAAAARALEINDRAGDARRRRLAGLIARLRHGLAVLGMPTTTGWFPVQSLPCPPSLAPAALQAHLAEAGMAVVLHESACRRRIEVSALIRADHTINDIDYLLWAIKRAVDAALPEPKDLRRLK